MTSSLFLLNNHSKTRTICQAQKIRFFLRCKRYLSLFITDFDRPKSVKRRHSNDVVSVRALRNSFYTPKRRKTCGAVGAYSPSMDSDAPEMYIVYISLSTSVFSGCITKLFLTLIGVVEALGTLDLAFFSAYCTISMVV